MPRNDDYRYRPPTALTAGEAGSADDFIARLVGEIVDSAGGQVGEVDGELSTIERRLAALREEEANPPPPARLSRPAPPPVPTVPQVVAVRDGERRLQTAEPVQVSEAPVRRRLSSEERLAALRALSDDLTEAETAVRHGARTDLVPASADVVVPELRRAQPRAKSSSVDDVIADAVQAGGAGIDYVAGQGKSGRERGSFRLAAVLSLVIVALSGLLALSWLSPTGSRGLLDGSAWRQAVALLGGADDIAVQTMSVADVSCEPAAGGVNAPQSLAQSAFPALSSATEPSAEARMPAVEPLSHGLRVVKTYRVGPDGRVEVPGEQLGATIPSRQALAEHSGTY